MASLDITIKKPGQETGKITVELDADQLERLAASLGFFNPDFLESLERAEADEKDGRIREISSLTDLRN